MSSFSKQDLDALAIFKDTFNARPDHKHLCFSEKLLTIEQATAYHIALEKLENYLNEKTTKKSR